MSAKQKKTLGTIFEKRTRSDIVWQETRYPEDLRTLSTEFNQHTAKLILTDTKRMIKWLKQHLKSEA